MSKSSKKSNEIVVDPEQNLVFNDEDELYDHFLSEINLLEKEFFDLRNDDDIIEGDFTKYEKNLSVLLDDPDEVWLDKKTFSHQPLAIYIKNFDETEPLFHVAVVYLTGEIPSFVYLHFPTREIDLIEKYRRGELIYDRVIKNAPLGAIEGDALLEGDELAVGLYQAMLKLRNPNDIPEDQFRNYASLREISVEEADEIWRTNDTMGNVLVSFIRDCVDEASKDIHYVVVTVEDSPSNSHALLFSFPTTDKNLLSRYRHGENLQAEEVIQESSH